MRIFRLFSFIVIISALLDVLPAMSARVGQEPKTFKTERGKCLSFDRFGHWGRRRAKRLRTHTCDPNNQDPDQWIYIRKINKHEGVFYNYAGNQIIGYNSSKMKFQVIDRVDLYRGGDESLSERDSPAYSLRVKLESLWRKLEKCKKKKSRQCSRKRIQRIRSKIKLYLRDPRADRILTHSQAKWIINRPRLKVRHRRSRNRRFGNMYFNIQDKFFRNGYYKILVNLNETEVVSMKEKFM